MNVIELHHVSKTHRRGVHAVSALTDVSLMVAPGEFVAVMGPSGSGKSTLLHLAGGLALPTSGEVLVSGVALTSMSATERALVRRREVGYVFQSANLLPGLTVAENVSFPLELDGASGREARSQAQTALASVGIEQLSDRTPDELSGGEAQRVAIARALIGDRRAVLADEPTGALDSVTGDAVVGLLREQADSGVSIVMVTHDARLAAWADRTIFLRDGSCIGAAGASDIDGLLTAHA